MRTIAFFGALLTLGASITASAQDVQPAPHGAIYDHGYTYFDLENFSEANGGPRVDTGWALKAQARLVGEGIPRDSAFIYKIRQGNQELGSTRCALGGERYNVITEWAGTTLRRCKDRDQRIQATGELTIDVVFVDGATDAETLVARHTIEVLTATRVGRNGEPTATTHYINQNGEVARAIINRVPKGMYGYAGAGRSGSANRVELIFVTAPSEHNRRDESHEDMSNMDNRLRCSVNGTPLEMAGPAVRAMGDLDSFTTATYSTGNDRREEQQIVDYRVAHYWLPLEWGDEKVGGVPVLEEHPGRWECVIRQNGDVIRGFSFQVAADGSIGAHPEEARGYQLGLGAHLVEMTIPNSQTFETRVDPSAVTRLGIGYGHQPQSDELKAAVGALPTLGDATVPQPRAARGRGRRGRRGRRR